MLLPVLAVLALSPTGFVAAQPGNFGRCKWLGGTPISRQGDVLVGTAGIRLTIAPTGRPVDCKVIYPRTPSPIGLWYCSVMLRDSRFHPAKDVVGKATYGIYDAWRWFDLNGLTPKIDRHDLYVPVNRLPPQVSDVQADYLVGSDGRIEQCRVSVGSGSPTLDTLACSTTIGQPFDVITDLSGTPVRSVRSRLIGFRKES